MFSNLEQVTVVVSDNSTDKAFVKVTDPKPEPTRAELTSSAIPAAAMATNQNKNRLVIRGNNQIAKAFSRNTRKR